MKKITYDFFYNLHNYLHDENSTSLSFVFDLFEDEDIQIVRDFADEILKQGAYFNIEKFPSICRMLGIYEEIIPYMIDKTDSFFILKDIFKDTLNIKLLEKVVLKMFEINERQALEFLRYYVGFQDSDKEENMIMNAVFKNHQDLYSKIVDYREYKKILDKIYDKKQDKNEEKKQLIELSKKYPYFINGEI